MRISKYYSNRVLYVSKALSVLEPWTSLFSPAGGGWVTMMVHLGSVWIWNKIPETLISRFPFCNPWVPNLMDFGLRASKQARTVILSARSGVLHYHKCKISFLSCVPPTFPRRVVGALPGSKKQSGVPVMLNFRYQAGTLSHRDISLVVSGPKLHSCAE